MPYEPVTKKKSGSGYVPVTKRVQMFPTLDMVRSASSKPAPSKADFNRSAFPTTSMVAPTVTGQSSEPRDVTRKGIVGKASEFLAPTRGFRDAEIAKAQPTTKETAIATGRYVAEMGGGILSLLHMGGKFIGEGVLPG